MGRVFCLGSLDTEAAFSGYAIKSGAGKWLGEVACSQPSRLAETISTVGRAPVTPSPEVQ